MIYHCWYQICLSMRDQEHWHEINGNAARFSLIKKLYVNDNTDIYLSSVIKANKLLNFLYNRHGGNSI